MMRRDVLSWAMLWMMLLSGISISVAAPSSAASLKDAVSTHHANVIFIRHALAPGFGDPADFDIKDCTTQRNLDDTGRQQARDLGAMLTSSGLVFDEILSSRWCRCQDTAKEITMGGEMAMGGYQTHDGLNSFFQDHVDRGETLRLLNEKLSSLNADDLVVMVTHQVVIQAITSISPRSGGMVLYNSKTGQSARFNP